LPPRTLPPSLSFTNPFGFLFFLSGWTSLALLPSPLLPPLQRRRTLFSDHGHAGLGEHSWFRRSVLFGGLLLPFFPPSARSWRRIFCARNGGRRSHSPFFFFLFGPFKVGTALFFFSPVDNRKNEVPLKVDVEKVGPCTKHPPPSFPYRWAPSFSLLSFPSLPPSHIPGSYYRFVIRIFSKLSGAREASPRLSPPFLPRDVPADGLLPLLAWARGTRTAFSLFF